MRLLELAEGCLEVPAQLCDLDVAGLTQDSREVKPGYVFVAVSGDAADGHDFATRAEAAGAIAVVGEKRPGALSLDVTAETRGVPDGRSSKLGIPYLQVSDSRLVLAQLGANFYGRPQREITLAGVTGTKGKTTTTWVLDSILRAAGKVSGLFGTVKNRVGDSVYPSKNTTPSSLELQRHLRELVEDGGSHAVVEVSSHGIAQRRIAGLDFHCAILTNISPEHLDYHGTFESYVEVKSRFFSELAEDACAVLPREEEVSARVASGTRAHICWYGSDSQDGVERLRMEPGSLSFVWKGTPVRTKLWGLHNLQNVLAAMTAAHCLGIPAECIAAGVEAAEAPPGRLEEISHPKDFHVFVDYAHTDASLETVLRTLRLMTRGRLIAVFGCGGDRDREKRPRMARVAEQCADQVVITSDNPRTEDPQSIIDEVRGGLKRPEEAVLEPDRRAAIGLSVRMARAGDIILVAGKGHEDYQELAEGRVPFDDRAVVREFLVEQNVFED